MESSLKWKQPPLWFPQRQTQIVKGCLFLRVKQVFGIYSELKELKRTRYWNCSVVLFMNYGLTNVFCYLLRSEIWTWLSSTKKQIRLRPKILLQKYFDICGQDICFPSYFYIWYLHGNAPVRGSRQLLNLAWIETCFPRRTPPPPIPYIPPTLPRNLLPSLLFQHPATAPPLPYLPHSCHSLYFWISYC